MANVTNKELVVLSVECVQPFRSAVFTLGKSFVREKKSFFSLALSLWMAVAFRFSGLTRRIQTTPACRVLVDEIHQHVFDVGFEFAVKHCPQLLPTISGIVVPMHVPSGELAFGSGRACDNAASAHDCTASPSV